LSLYLVLFIPPFSLKFFWHSLRVSAYISFFLSFLLPSTHTPPYPNVPCDRRRYMFCLCNMSRQILHYHPVTRYAVEFSMFLRAPWQNCEKRLLASLCLTDRLSAWYNWTPTGLIFIKFDIWVFIENLSKTIQVSLKRTRITSSLHEDQYTFFIISRSFFC
jgi:hypothetical protein